MKTDTATGTLRPVDIGGDWISSRQDLPDPRPTRTSKTVEVAA